MISIKKAYKSEYAAIKKIYLESFPLVERKPLALIKYKVKKGSAQILCLKADKQVCGLIITAQHNDIMLVDYFAIDAKFRNKGIGTEAIKEFLKVYSEQYRVFLEIEKPDTSDVLKARRKAFYMRNGLSCSGTEISLFGVPMELLYFTKPVDFNEYHELYKKVYGKIWARGVKFVKQNNEI